jgi:hypothetical protein
MILALATIRELLEPGPEPPQRVSRVWRPPDQIGKRGNWNVEYLLWKRLMLLKKPLLQPKRGRPKSNEEYKWHRRPPITPEEVLREMLTVFLLVELYPDFLKDDGKPLSVQVARSVFKLRPSGKSHTNSHTPPYTACLLFGDRLRSSPVWVFMMRNLETIKVEDQARKERAKKMYEPMKPRVPSSVTRVPSSAAMTPVLSQPQPQPTQQPTANVSASWRDFVQKAQEHRGSEQPMKEKK